MTKHSLKRAKERANLSNSAATKMFTNAFLHGRKSCSLPYKERIYLEEQSSIDRVAMYYNNFCFIFTSTGVCITMYPAPSWFLSKSNYDGKTIVRNPRKYYSKYRKDEYERIQYDC